MKVVKDCDGKIPSNEEQLWIHIFVWQTQLNGQIHLHIHLSFRPQLQLRFVLDEEHRAESAHGLVKYHRVTLEVPRKTKWIYIYKRVTLFQPSLQKQTVFS